MFSFHFQEKSLIIDIDFLNIFLLRKQFIFHQMIPNQLKYNNILKGSIQDRPILGNFLG